MKQMQKAYEKIRSHLIEQGRPASDAMTGSCFYRHPDGLMCAVGCMITDDVYRPSLEDCTVDDVGVRLALVKSGWPMTPEGFEMLHDMQSYHDKWKVGDDDGLRFVIEQIDRVAEEYKLEVVK
ncbi:MAG: hypothetical protein ACR2IJ_00490 [Fluviibacter sp.]